ncbi:resolvase, partial [Escherichia coli]|nr:resolvase [Escherichia coli]EEZ0404791.1 resolvase [Escherichia coli]EFG5623781.1 resolvase [Escherichia coli]EFJ9627298.1 resolvase [Escherichia coli]EGM9492057.1 resolvase [Escherichia coli]
MSGSVIHSQSAAMVPAVYSAGQSPQLPVVIDYPAALALRQMSMVHDELPKYLLAPEV